MSIRVLLISPLQGVDPYCGDVVYTEALLNHPPAGVEYVPYTEALASGGLIERARRGEYEVARGLEKGTVLARIARERAINRLRAKNVLFWEPFRHFSVKPGEYDLIHCHVFSASFTDSETPLVLSNANLIDELYSGARQWSTPRVRLGLAADRAIARLQGVQHTSLGMPRVSAMVTFTETLKRELVDRQAVAAEKVHVAPCFVDAVGDQTTPQHRPTRVGFVAGDFDAKGGRTVIEAFERLLRARPDAELLVIGSPVREDLMARGNGQIRWIPRVPRESLIADYIPRFDVLAYPTECDGLPLTVLEAMAAGVPIATSDYRAMPEVIGWGAAGTITPQKQSGPLAEAIDWLLDPEMNAAVRRGVRLWHAEHYSAQAAQEKLLQAYEAALRGRVA